MENKYYKYDGKSLLHTESLLTSYSVMLIGRCSYILTMSLQFECSDWYAIENYNKYSYKVIVNDNSYELDNTEIIGIINRINYFLDEGIFSEELLHIVDIMYNYLKYIIRCDKEFKERLSTFDTKNYSKH